VENLLLANLPVEALDSLRRHFERVTLRRGQHAIVPDEPIRHCYFPLNCLLSMVTTMRDGSAVECGNIGREGMSGVPVLLDAGTTTMPTFCQIPGEAVRVSAEVVKEAYEGHRGVRKYFNRYIHAVIVTGSNSAACNRLHRLEERLARWLLMSSDSVGSDELALTHEYLAMMMGVRRAGVTEAAVRLKDAGLIAYRRGAIKILDRGRLEAESCECYARTKAEYERLFAVAA
jgi:CRP-like cAMP-binding protein